MSTNMDYGWLADVANEVGITDDDLTALSTPGFIARAMMTAMDRNAIAACQTESVCLYCEFISKNVPTCHR